MASSNYDLILRFISDQSAKQKAEGDVDALNKKLGEVEKHAHEINRIGHDAGLVKAMDEAAKAVQGKLNPALKESVKHEKDLVEAAKQASKEASAQASIFSRQAAILSNQVSQLRQRAEALTRTSSVIGQASGIGLALGGGVVGGILAEAGRYAKEAEDAGRATRATREWTRATQELAAARARVDKVLLREALPLLQKAAELATRASQFVERHPEIVQAALNTGLVVAGLSAVGLAVSKGIKFYADQLYLASVPIQLQAAELQAAAAQQQLVAAQLQAESRGIEVAGGAPAKAAGGFLGTAVPIIGGTLTAAAVGVAIEKQLNTIEKLAVDRFGKIGKFIDDALAAPLARIVPGFGLIRTLDPIFQGFIRNIEGLGKAARDTGQQVEQAITGLRGSAHEGEIVAAFEQWQKDDARIVQEAAERRVQIVRDAESRIAAATAQFSSRVASINAAAQKREESITANFLKAEAEAETRYQEQRARIVRDGAESIRDIEEAHQERLRQMTADHNERVEDLTAARDALGLAKENRRFKQAVSEEDRGTRQEIAKRRAETAERLAELDRQHQAEKAQRQAAFQEALAENEAQRKEQLKEAAAAHAEELKQIRDQRAQQLRELQIGLNAERARRREVFIEQIRDLDVSLLGERSLRNQRYSEMLADVDAFLSAYRAKLNTLGSDLPVPPPVHDYTGMAYPGIYRMADNGQPQWVMSGAATRAAEQIIGGRLTQDAMLTALARGAGGSRRSLTINDHSRFDGRISAREVRAIKRETIGEIVRELR